MEAVATDRLNEAEAARVGLLLALEDRGFYAAAADGVALTDAGQVG